MTWTTMPTKATSDVYTAALWNTYNRDNMNALHDALNPLTLQASFLEATPDPVNSGNYRAAGLQIAQDAYASLYIPSNFVTLTTAVIVFNPDATETFQFDLVTNYAANGESDTTHTGGANNITQAATASQLVEVDISSYLASLAAGDYLGLKITSDTNNIYPMLVVLEYSPF